MRRRLKLFALLMLVGPLVAAPPAARGAPPRSGGPRREARAEQITTQQLQAYLRFIADDQLEGRNTPSRGLDIAASYIASHLERWGLTPAGDGGTYFQRILLQRGATRPEGCRAELNGQTFTYGDDYFAAPVPGTASGSLVYAGHGWMVKARDVDAFRGVDVKGKIVVVVQSTFGPPGIRRNELTGTAGEDYADPMTYARQRGALALLTLLPRSTSTVGGIRRRTENRSWQVQRLLTRRGPELPQIHITERMARILFEGEKTDLDAIYRGMEERQPLPAFELNPEKRLTVTLDATLETATTQNVVATFEGRDPALKNECVAAGAHYDHLGMANAPPPGGGASAPPGVSRDTIFNGADDDGSGTVALLAMAEALAGAGHRPRRSVLFIWHCGEEEGLWGSDYFTTYPTVPLDRMAAMLNVDMIGRSKKPGDTNPRNAALSGPDEVYLIGPKQSSAELGQLSDRVNSRYLHLRFNDRYDDPKDPNRYFSRSDHYNYAKKGVPILFYFAGTHQDYHRVSDQIEAIDFPKLEKVTRTIYQTLWELAEQKKRPAIDKRDPSR